MSVPHPESRFRESPALMPAGSAGPREEETVPRRARVVVKGAYYHVFSRGNQRRCVFRDDEDRRWFLGRLWRVERETRAIHLAHCLMGNHFHLIVRPGAPGLSRLLHGVLGPYAQWFNRRHGQVGHLFQDRFGSTVLDTEEALLWAVRYVHRNPVEAGLVRRASEWKWSSHRDHLQKMVPDYLESGARVVRRLISDDEDAAIADLDVSVNSPVGASKPPLRSTIRSLDGPAPSAGELAAREVAEVARARLRSLAGLLARAHRLEHAAGIVGTSHDPGVQAARRELCFRALRVHRLPVGQIAEFLGTSVGQVRRLARQSRPTRNETTGEARGGSTRVMGRNARREEPSPTHAG